MTENSNTPRIILSDSALTFPSLARPNMRYRLYESYDASPAHNWLRDSGISSHVSQFDTMGDGETQHAPEAVVPKTQMLDFLRSFFAIIHLLPEGELPKCIVRAFCYKSISAETMAFVWSLKYNENKTVYVNLSDNKKSTSESKRHDKRWFELKRFHCQSDEVDTAQKRVGAAICLLNSDVETNNNRSIRVLDMVQMVCDIKHHTDADLYDCVMQLNSFDCFKQHDWDEAREIMSRWELIRDWIIAKDRIERIQGSSKWFVDNLENVAAMTM